MERTTRLIGTHTHEQTALTPFLDRESLTLEDFAYTETRIVKCSRDYLRQQRLIVGYSPCAFVDAYKVLRTRVLHKLRESNGNTLAVTAPPTGSGKTLTAINLALSLALEMNRTVLLVDANLRDPAVHRYFGISPAHGLSDHLRDNVPINRMLVNPDGIPRFVLLPGGRSLVESSEMLASPKMARLVDEFKRRYPSRYVVFDLPHLGTPDALCFAPQVDGVLLVAEEGKTPREELARALELIPDSQLLGVALNKAGPMQ
jgi:protein-tyrosine kinase